MNKSLSAVLAISLLGFAACGKSDDSSSTKAPAPSPKSTAPAVTAKSYSGGISGKISFTGTLSKKNKKGRKIKMGADAKCDAQHPGGFRYKPIAVGEGGGLADVFVYVAGGLEGKSFPVPAEAKAILDQRGCWYTPRVSGIMVGQTLTILNSDPTMHNVNASPEFNAAMPAVVKKLEKKFKKPKVMFKLKCNVHPWMSAYVGVLEHPYYAVSGEDGMFEIKNLPPGGYTVSVWHEKLGVAEAAVTVGEGFAALNFTLSKGKG